MGTICLLAILMAIGAFAADRIEKLKKNQIVLGLYFGVFSIIASFASSQVAEPHIFAGVIDVPCMIAGFFFGVVPAIVAAGIGAVGHILPMLLGIPHPFWGACCFAILMVGFYSMMTAKLFFSEQRPAIFPTALGFGFGEVIHIIVFYIGAIRSPEYSLTAIYDSLDFALFGAILAGILVAIACRTWGNLRSNLLNRTVLFFVLFDLCCLIVLGVALEESQHQTCRRLEHSMDELFQNFTGQMRYMLHRAANLMREEPSFQGGTSADLEQLAARLHIDEINILDKTGLVIQSNKQEYLKTPTKKNIKVDHMSFVAPFLVAEDGFVIDHRKPLPNLFSVTAPLLYTHGYVEVVLLRNRAIGEYDVLLAAIMKDRVVQHQGFFLLTESDGNIIFISDPQVDITGKTIFDLGLTKYAWKTRPFTPFAVKMNSH